MARLSAQSSRGDCCLRLFHRADLWFRTVYCFFAIEHDRRRILHFNVTSHPTSDWIVQQLRETFPLPCPYRYVLFDHDAKFGNDVVQFLKSSDLTPLRPGIRSPWQNGIAERWVGSVRRELLDHVIPLKNIIFGGWDAHTLPTITPTGRTLL